MVRISDKLIGVGKVLQDLVLGGWLLTGGRGAPCLVL